jgi:hypothetical protein
MTRNKLVGVVGVDLGVVIDGTKDLQRLLPKMRGDGLITSEKSTTGLRTQLVTRAETRAETEQRLTRFVAFATSFFGFQ